MTARINKITRDTLVPVGIVLALIMATWAVASDRQQAIAQIEVHGVKLAEHALQIRELADKLSYLTEAMLRIEGRLGTLPPRADE